MRTTLTLLLLAACATNAPLYAKCASGGDCAAPSDGCYHLLFDRSDGTTGDGNLCSRHCAADSECPANGACIALDPDPTLFCAARCATSADCYSGSRCTPATGIVMSQLCLP